MHETDDRDDRTDELTCEHPLCTHRMSPDDAEEGAMLLCSAHEDLEDVASSPMFRWMDVAFKLRYFFNISATGTPGAKFRYRVQFEGDELPVTLEFLNSGWVDLESGYYVYDVTAVQRPFGQALLRLAWTEAIFFPPDITPEEPPEGFQPFLDEPAIEIKYSTLRDDEPQWAIDEEAAHKGRLGGAGF